MGTFVHTADTHLGYQQYHQPERENDYYGAFGQVIEGAIDIDADAVVHAGDFFHNSRPSTRTLRYALEQLHRLDRNNIPFLGIVGNHEGTQTDQWIDIFSEFDLATHLSNEPEIVADTAFYGLDFVPESRRPHLSMSFDPHTAEHAILVAHGLFEPISPYGDWDIQHVIGNSRVEFDAVLLGDDHDHRTQRINDTILTYAGSTERTAIDQRQDRVYNRISTTNDKSAWVKRVPLDTRPHVFLEIALSPGEGPERIRRELDETDIEAAIVAVLVMGDGEDFAPAGIEEYGRENGAFIVRVSDRRKLDTEELAIDVHFADPDEAIHEHIMTMDLSMAAYDIEQKVRSDPAIPKSNLADEIEREFTDRVTESVRDLTRQATIESPADTHQHDPSDPPTVRHADTHNNPSQSSSPVALESPENEEAARPSGTAQLRLDELDT